MDLSDFDSSLMVWVEDVNLAEKAIKAGTEFMAPSHDMVDSSADTIEQVTLALLNGDSSSNGNLNLNLMPTTLLNNFVSAMAPSVARGSPGEGPFHFPFYEQGAFEIEIDAGNECRGPSRSRQLNLTAEPSHSQRSSNGSGNGSCNVNLPQHLIINEAANVKDGYSHSIHNIASTSANDNGHVLLQPIFPPNYFLPAGTVPWDPSLHCPSPTLVAKGCVAAANQSLFSSLRSFTNPVAISSLAANSQGADHTQYYTKKMDAASLMKTNATAPRDMFQLPLDLRSNFIEAQRIHGADSRGIVQDPLVVQHHSTIGQGLRPFAKTPCTESAKKSVSERNEREQRRAQQITELIDELKETMVKDGWKVEMKGKYHTLSRLVT